MAAKSNSASYTSDTTSTQPETPDPQREDYTGPLAPDEDSVESVKRPKSISSLNPDKEISEKQEAAALLENEDDATALKEDYDYESLSKVLIGKLFEGTSLKLGVDAQWSYGSFDCVVEEGDGEGGGYISLYGIFGFLDFENGTCPTEEDMDGFRGNKCVLFDDVLLSVDPDAGTTKIGVSLWLPDLPANPQKPVADARFPAVVILPLTSPSDYSAGEDLMPTQDDDGNWFVEPDVDAIPAGWSATARAGTFGDDLDVVVSAPFMVNGVRVDAFPVDSSDDYLEVEITDENDETVNGFQIIVYCDNGTISAGFGDTYKGFRKALETESASVFGVDDTVVQLHADPERKIYWTAYFVPKTYIIGWDFPDIPEGGAVGQILVKASGDDYDVAWVDQTGGGGGGASSFNQLTGTINDGQISNNRIVERMIADDAVTDIKIDSVSASKITGEISDARIPASIARDTELPAANRLVPAGGDDGQVLKKTSGSDYDVAWEADLSGTGGLASVATDDTLTGEGTPTNTLSVANPFTAPDETKLDGIEAGAEVNVQPDWSEADGNSDAFVLNKPGDNRFVPSGGSDGQVLKKTSDSDYATAWEADNATVATDGTIDGDGSPGSELSLADDAVTDEKLADSTVAARHLDSTIPSDGQILEHSSVDGLVWVDKPSLAAVDSFVSSLSANAYYTYSHTTLDLPSVFAAGTWDAMVSEGNGDFLFFVHSPSSFSIRRYSAADPGNDTDRDGKTYGHLADADAIIPSGACKTNDGKYYYVTKSSLGHSLYAFDVSPSGVSNQTLVGSQFTFDADWGDVESLAPWPGTNDIAAFTRNTNANAAHLLRINPSDPDDSAGIYGDQGIISDYVRGAASIHGSFWGVGDGLLLRVNPSDVDDVSGVYGEVDPTVAGSDFSVGAMFQCSTEWEGRLYAVGTDGMPNATDQLTIITLDLARYGATVETDGTLAGDGSPGSVLGIAGADAATDGYVLTSDGAGGIAFALPASGGLSAVATESALTGDGTSASPLDIADDGISTIKIGGGAVTNSKLTDNTISESKMSISNDPSSDQVLSWNGTAMSWADVAAGGSGFPDPDRVFRYATQTDYPSRATANGGFWLSGGDMWSDAPSSTEIVLSADDEDGEVSGYLENVVPKTCITARIADDQWASWRITTVHETVYSLTGTLPDGVYFDAGLRRLRGTPRVTGTFPVVLRATAGSGTFSEQPFDIVIA